NQRVAVIQRAPRADLAHSERGDEPLVCAHSAHASYCLGWYSDQQVKKSPYRRAARPVSPLDTIQHPRQACDLGYPKLDDALQEQQVFNDCVWKHGYPEPRRHSPRDTFIAANLHTAGGPDTALGKEL